jgi:hypothetical protein
MFRIAEARGSCRSSADAQSVIFASEVGKGMSPHSRQKS